MDLPRASSDFWNPRTPTLALMCRASRSLINLLTLVTVIKAGSKLRKKVLALRLLKFHKKKNIHFWPPIDADSWGRCGDGNGCSGLDAVPPGCFSYFVHPRSLEYRLVLILKPAHVHQDNKINKDQ